MPFKVTYNVETSGILIEAFGVVNDNEAISTLQEVLDHPAFPSIKYLISDRTNCTQYDLSSKTAEKASKLADRALSINKHFLWAIVSPKDLEFGISRMFQSYADENLRTFVVRTRADADELIKKELNNA